MYRNYLAVCVACVIEPFNIPACRTVITYRVEGVKTSTFLFCQLTVVDVAIEFSV